MCDVRSFGVVVQVMVGYAMFVFWGRGTGNGRVRYVRFFCLGAVALVTVGYAV